MTTMVTTIIITVMVEPVRLTTRDIKMTMKMETRQVIVPAVPRVVVMEAVPVVVVMGAAAVQ